MGIGTEQIKNNFRLQRRTGNRPQSAHPRASSGDHIGVVKAGAVGTARSIMRGEVLVLAGQTVELWQFVSDGKPGRHRSRENMVVTAAAWVVVQRPEGNDREATLPIHARHR